MSVRFPSVFVASLFLAAAAAAETVTLNPVADATLHSETNQLANGAGDYLFAGQTGRGFNRRALLRFDLSSVPASATVTEVTLTLFMSRTIVGGETVSLHVVTSGWVEGPSDPFGEEGGGIAAMVGDCTWTHREYDTTLWTTPGGGGDFVAAPSASGTVGASLADYSWASPGLVADVQAWVDGSQPNNGWLLKGNEAGPGTAKRFNSRDNLSFPPRLTVTYQTGTAPCPCELDGTAGVDVFDLLAYLDLWFAEDSAADIDDSAGVDVFDLLTFLDCWFPASAGSCP